MENEVKRLEKLKISRHMKERYKRVKCEKNIGVFERYLTICASCDVEPIDFEGCKYFSFKKFKERCFTSLLPRDLRK